MATPWVNPDKQDAGSNTGFMDLLDNAITTGGKYLIADKTGAVPDGYSRAQNTGAVPANVTHTAPAKTTPTIMGASAMFHGIDMRYVAAGFGVLLIFGLLLRR